MTTKMSIKSIILFEKMTNIPFSNLSFSAEYIMNNPDIFLKLLYCILISHDENNIKCTFEEACKEIFTQDKLIKYSQDLSNEIMILNQFVNFDRLKNVEQSPIKKKDDSSDENKSVYMKNLVPVLVMDCGLDPDYVLNKMSYTDIDDYFKYREDKHRNLLEEKRLFTFLTVLPHLNGKKIKTPEKFLPFPWEKEANKKKALRDLEKAKQKLIQYGIIQEKS